MARGWESKAIEDQVDNHQQTRFGSDADNHKLTDAARHKQTQIRSLESSRARITNQLAAATNPAYRTSLARALESLDTQISALKQKND